METGWCQGCGAVDVPVDESARCAACIIEPEPVLWPEDEVRQ